MKLEIIEDIWNQVAHYIGSLDWAYILTFMLIAHGINHHKIKEGLKNTLKLKSKTRYRIALVGILYGIAIYFIRGYEIAQVERLIQSLVFAFVFHKLIIDGMLGYIFKKILPEKWAKFLKQETTSNELHKLNGSV